MPGLLEEQREAEQRPVQARLKSTPTPVGRRGPERNRASGSIGAARRRSARTKHQPATRPAANRAAEPGTASRAGRGSPPAVSPASAGDAEQQARARPRGGPGWRSPFLTCGRSGTMVRTQTGTSHQERWQCPARQGDQRAAQHRAERHPERAASRLRRHQCPGPRPLGLGTGAPAAPASRAAGPYHRGPRHGPGLLSARPASARLRRLLIRLARRRPAAALEDLAVAPTRHLAVSTRPARTTGGHAEGVEGGRITTAGSAEWSRRSPKPSGRPLVRRCTTVTSSWIGRRSPGKRRSTTAAPLAACSGTSEPRETAEASTARSQQIHAHTCRHSKPGSNCIPRVRRVN